MRGSRLADKANAAVEAYFEEYLSVETKKAKIDALNDLYFGPQAHFDEETDEGTEEVVYRKPYTFGKAVKILSDWWDKVGGDVWYDVQSEEVFDKEPKGYEDEDNGEWIEPAWEDYVHYDSSDAKRVFFGSELASHV